MTRWRLHPRRFTNAGKCANAAFNAAPLPVRASGSSRRITWSSGRSSDASIPAVASSEPSSITTINLLRASTSNRRPMLSRIVTSSLRAGTKKIQLNGSAYVGSRLACSCFTRRYQMPLRQKRQAFQTKVNRTTTSVTVNQSCQKSGRPL